jgi:hypothetical protein
MGVGSIIKRLTGQASTCINTRRYLKNKQSKNTGGEAQLLECLPSKCKAVSSTPNTAKKKN